MIDHRDPPEYELRPESPARPKALPARPIRVAPLEYESEARPAPFIVSGRVQFVLGLLLPFAYWFPALLLIVRLPAPAVGLVIAMPLFIAIIGYLRVRLQWTAFIPGMLITLLALPLIVVLSCGILLSSIM